MKPEELRIGNWVNNWEGNPVQVTSFSETKLGLIVHWKGYEITEIGKATVLSGDKSGESTPIPITPEWLERFGQYNKDRREFNNTQGELMEWRNGFLELGDKNPECHPYSVKVHYIHQLQNLYHALTGEELTLKENAKANT